MMKKRILSLLLSVCMLASVCSGVTLSAFAKEVDAPVAEGVSAFPYGEGGERSEREAVLPGNDSVLRTPAPKRRTASAEFLPVETAPAEEVTAELQATYTGTCGENLSWSFITNTGKLTISGSGAMWEYESSYNEADGSYTTTAPWSVYIPRLESVSIGDGVTSISDSAFAGCTALESVSIGSGVSSVGFSAFRFCYNLTSFFVDPSNQYFSSENGALFDKEKTRLYYCPGGSTTVYTLPDSVESVYDITFENARKLTEILVSDNHPSLSSENGALLSKDKTALYCCPKGKSGAYAIPDTVTYIWLAFEFSDKLTQITIPGSVTEIEEFAFQYCTDLTSITIPDSVTTLGEAAFHHCTGLTSAYIGNGVTEIPDYAFNSCRNLQNVSIGANVARIGYSAFWGSDRISNVTYYGTSTEWDFISVDNGNAPLLNAFRTYSPNEGRCGENATWFYNTSTGVLSISGSGKMWDYYAMFQGEEPYITTAPWGRYYDSITSVSVSYGITTIGCFAFAACGMRSVSLPSSVTEIGRCSFRNCDNLTSVTIPNSVTSIRNHAFWDCNNLTSIAIPDSVTSIGAFAFYDCNRLLSITIPDSVTSIGEFAFCYCRGLMSVTIGDSVTSIGSHAFYSCDNLTNISIPAGVKEIWYGAFSNCAKLTAISVASGNSEYTAVDGVLFSKDMTILCCCPAAKTGTYSIPDGVWLVASCAFGGSALTEIRMPSGVTTLLGSAFEDCTSLQRIALPGTITEIYKGAFLNCPALQTIIYCGTETQWNAMQIGEENAPLQSASRQYHDWNSGTVTTAATCGKAGVRTCTCALCGETKAETIPALEHDLVHHAAKPATCTQAGWKAYDTCSRCDYTTYAVTPALGHSLIHHGAKAATCEAAGWGAYDICTRCDYTTYKELSALGHNMVVTQQVAPTPEKNGLEVRTCSRCGKTEHITIPYITGDLNGDGELTAKDVTLMRRFLAGGYSVTLANELVADTNKDGVVNAKDITILRRHVTGGYGVVLS